MSLKHKKSEHFNPLTLHKNVCNPKLKLKIKVTINIKTSRKHVNTRCSDVNYVQNSTWKLLRLPSFYSQPQVSYDNTVDKAFTIIWHLALHKRQWHTKQKEKKSRCLKEYQPCFVSDFYFHKTLQKFVFPSQFNSVYLPTHIRCTPCNGFNLLSHLHPRKMHGTCVKAHPSK